MVRRALFALGYAVFVGLVGAVIVHIAILFLLPALSDQDAWSELAEIAGPHQFVILDDTGPAPHLMRNADPFFQTAACRFDLAQGIVHATAPGAMPFWSASVYDRSGHNIYSFNDRSATDGTLDVVLVSPAQMLELRKALPADFQRSIIIELTSQTGILVLRRFVPDRTWRKVIAGSLAQAECALMSGEAAED